MTDEDTHSCHDECQRLACRQSREIKRLEALSDYWFAKYETLRDSLVDALARDDALGDTQ